MIFSMCGRQDKTWVNQKLEHISSHARGMTVGFIVVSTRDHRRGAAYCGIYVWMLLHMPAQDDAREQQMIDRFNLTVPSDRGRSDVDAYLEMPGVKSALPFELKSATRGSVSTVRDFGPEHIAKWRHLHWLFAFYDQAGSQMQFCYYASPADMRAWILEKETYVRPDILLAEQAQSSLDTTIIDYMFGDVSAANGENYAPTAFSLDQAKSVMKRQWSAAEYVSRADLPDN